MAWILVGLCLASPFDTFSEPLDPARWYIGVGQPPKKGWLRIPKGGWIVSRGIDDERFEKAEIIFRHKGGTLEMTFHTAREPLSRPRGEPIRVKRGKGVRTLVVTKDGARLDGEKLPWDGKPRGTFRLAAVRGDLEVDEVRVEPRLAEPAALTGLEKQTVHFATTPRTYRSGDAIYTRSTLTLWDAEVCFLFRRGEPAFELLRAPVRGAPVLGVLITGGDARALALKAGSHPGAMRDWGDERGNLSRGAFMRYLQGEYAQFALLQDAQRALNAAVPERAKELEPLVHLAVIRHTANVRAAQALAETQGAKKALAALRKALGDARGRVTGDRVRAAAGKAARAILGEVPAQWPNFTFDPSSRFVTIEQCKELTR